MRTDSSCNALRDQLRAVNCPNEVSKAIGGWSEGNDVSSSYGLGYELDVIADVVIQGI